jgi:hypothetical protein
VSGRNSKHNPNEFFSNIEVWLLRGLAFLIFLVGLFKVGWDTLEKILK